MRQRHKRPEASPPRSQYPTISCEVFEQTATMCRNLWYHVSLAIIHPAAGRFCQSELRAVGQEEKKRNKKPRQKPCGAAHGFTPKRWSFATLPTSDRAVTVKGVGDEVDTGPMTVVTSQLYYTTVFFLPSASFHFQSALLSLLSVDTTLPSFLTLPLPLCSIFFHDRHCHLVLEVFGRS